MDLPDNPQFLAFIAVFVVLFIPDRMLERALRRRYPEILAEIGELLGAPNPFNYIRFIYSGRAVRCDTQITVLVWVMRLGWPILVGLMIVPA